ncbi:ArnT family glycosyltransferase [Kitasatospora sp. NPDC101176]|uniref:ArnT family glycosyltransferase n=1 Tax=Kitasatospora sp. NPDC101176 TaxID=3364099 RepID=UPI003814695C
MTTAPHDDSVAVFAPPRSVPEEAAGPGRRHAAPGTRLARLWRGHPEDPRWARPALFGLLLATGLLYLWNLSASGYANTFYSAAAQAGSVSWKAFFFGSLDGANSITVDKPPASLWPMDLSVRLFGLNSWAILVPEVLMGLATVAVLYASVRRRFGPVAGLISGAALALTPVAALMFRFNNPDALLALLLTLSVSFVLRAVEDGRTKWLLWAGVATGFAFLTKQLQAFLILPPLALVYLVCAPVKTMRRVWQLLLGGLAMAVAGGWWVAIVELWPASSRPYIGGSTNNSFLELTFGYNGLNRVDSGGSTSGTGLLRLFNESLGGQISWLLPAALILFVAGLLLTLRAPRTDTARAAFLAWGGALLTTAVVFSFMSGIFHEYYTVALAPYIAALVGIGTTALWQDRARKRSELALAVTAGATAVWAWALLDRTSDYGVLKWLVLAGGAATMIGLALSSLLGRRTSMALAVLGLVVALAGPFAYTVSTVTSAHGGGQPTAGPTSTSSFAGPGGGGKGGPPGGGPMGGGEDRSKDASGDSGQQQAPSGGTEVGPGGLPAPSGGGKGGPGGAGPGGMGGAGGSGGGQSVSSEVQTLLKQDADHYTWVAAGVSSHTTDTYQLSTGKPVMSIGGFNGIDPSPTLTQFQEYVSQGKIHYYIAGGGQGPGPGGGGGSTSTGSSSEITKWVEAHFKKVTVGTTTLYDLTQMTSS